MLSYTTYQLLPSQHLIGFAIVAAYLVIRYLLDDTISTEEDVRKYLRLNTLASIPYDKSLKM